MELVAALREPPTDLAAVELAQADHALGFFAAGDEERDRSYRGGVQALGGRAGARREVEDEGGDRNRRSLAVGIGARSPAAMAAERARVEGASGVEVEDQDEEDHHDERDYRRHHHVVVVGGGEDRLDESAQHRSLSRLGRWA